MVRTAGRVLLAVTADISIPFVNGTARHLARLGWDVHVVSAPGPHSRALAAEGGVTVHPLAMPRDPSPVRDARALLQAVRLLRRVRPDVISAATPKAGLVLGLAAALCRVPVRVYQLWGLRYETTSGSARRLLRGLEKLSAWSATHVVAVSESLRRAAVADGVVTAGRVSVLGPGSSHGVDTDRFAIDPDARREGRLARWPQDADLPVVGFVGRIHPDKGIDTLVAAVELLSAQDLRARLLLVGGAEGAEGALASLAATSWEVDSLGHVDDVAPVVGLLDVLCLPSRREGFPNVVLEAAAAGVPSVTTPATGTIDAVLDGRTGLVAVDHDPQSLASALRALLMDAELRRRLGAAARERVVEEFDQRLVWERYADLYERLLGESGTRR